MRYTCSIFNDRLKVSSLSDWPQR